MENNLQKIAESTNEQKNENLPTPVQPKKWYGRKIFLISIPLVILIAFGGWFVFARKFNDLKKSLPLKQESDLKTYSDQAFSYSLKYPSSLHLVTISDYDHASTTGKISIQSQPEPELFRSYYNESREYISEKRPYARKGFAIKINPDTRIGAELTEKEITNYIALQKSCKLEEVRQLEVSGVRSYKLAYTGEDTGNLLVVVPYSIDRGLEINFETSYDPGSPEYKDALRIFQEVLQNFKFENFYTLEKWKQERAQALSQITWKKYSNPFLEFEYSSDFEPIIEKIITDHAINPNTKKDMYGLVSLTLKNRILGNAHIDVSVVPNFLKLGGERVDKNSEIFQQEKENPSDTFEFVSVDGNRASMVRKVYIDDLNLKTCESKLRLGTKKVNFYTKDYIYEIELVYDTEEYNDPESIIQKEFQKFLDSFHIIEPAK